MHYSEMFSPEFSNIQNEIDKEQELKEGLKEIIKEIERCAREILVVVQDIYSVEGLSRISETCVRARGMFTEVRIHFSRLKSEVQRDMYYRYNDMWRFVTQRLVFLAAYIVFLESHSLLPREEAIQFLGVDLVSTDGFHLDMDDLLNGWAQLAEELPRLSVCCATFGNYDLPFIIAKFLSALENSFRLLSSKGEPYRKRIDCLKYSSKKASDIVYDLTIRGLVRPKVYE